MSKIKTVTEPALKKLVKQHIKELKEKFDDLDILMDESEIAAENMTDKQIERGLSDRFHAFARLLESARDHIQMAYDDLECI